MKILVLTAQFPPNHSGGYELRIKNILDGLSQKGHTIRVLTTCVNKPVVFRFQPTDYPVIRKLHNRYQAKFFPKEILFDFCDTNFLSSQIKAFQPDLIYLGHIYVLSKALLPYLADVHIPIVLDEGGASLKGAWTERGRWFRFTGDYGEENLLIRAVKPLVIKLVCWLSGGRMTPTWRWPEKIQVIFNNKQNLHDKLAMNMPIKGCSVIHSGIDVDLFQYKPIDELNKTLNIIYPARIEPLKRQLDAIRLITALEEVGIKSHLLLIGTVFSQDYLDQLLAEIYAHQLDELVQIQPLVSQKTLVKHYHKADICFFPTYHRMGFSRVPLEAMACGCVVISYGNEGSNEIIKHNQNGFIIKPEDYQQAVKIIMNLMSHPKNVDMIVSQAREDIEKEHSLETYIEKINTKLITIVQDMR